MGLTACSTNMALEGSTYCVDTQKGERCPITEIKVYNIKIFPPSSSLWDDSIYETQISSEPIKIDENEG